MFDVEDSNDFDFSVLDRAKIEDLDVGEKMESESGRFLVGRTKNHYEVWYVKENSKGREICTSLEIVFEFLEDN